MPTMTYAPALGRPTLRPPVKTHGGKYYLATAHLEAIFGRCATGPLTTLVDAFGGGGTVALNAAAPNVVYNDLDPAKFNLFWVIRNFPDKLIEALNSIEFGERCWNISCEWCERYTATTKPGTVPIPDVNWAAWYVVRSRMSRGGMGKTFGRSTRERGGLPEYVNAWTTGIRELPRVADRVKNWLIVNSTADRLLASPLGECPDVLFYLDPPYLASTRTVAKVYDYEMNDPERHAELLKAAKACRSVVAICGYHSDLYDAELRDWTLFEWRVKNNSGQGKKKQDRVECLWVNRPPADAN